MQAMDRITTPVCRQRELALYAADNWYLKEKIFMSEFEWMGDVRGLTPADTLQDALDKTGSAVGLLWKPGTPFIEVPRVPREFTGWAREQRAWEEGVALLELSHHMTDLFIEGPDAVRLLSAVSAN